MRRMIFWFYGLVFLVPPSESPPQFSGQYSEPYRLDYHRWAEEIARLSLEHTYLTAWVIDDFHANHQLFTPAYLRELQARANTNVTVAFRLIDKKGVSNFGVRWRMSDLRAEGLQPAADFSQPQNWKVSRQGAFETGFDSAVRAGQRRFHVPFISMTAADVHEFRLRHGDPATPPRIADQLRLSLQAWQEGKCDGVVTYCLDKQPASQTFPLVQQLFHAFPKDGNSGDHPGRRP